MKRGFPRPRTFVKELHGFYLGRRLSKEQMAEFGNREYPHPYSAHDTDLADIHAGRVKECTHFKKCIVCGEPVHGEKVWVYRNESGLNSDSGPFHEKCKILTQKLCPAVATSANTAFKWSFEDWEAIAPIIRGRAD